MKPKLVQRDAAVLAEGYNTLQRRLNVAGTTAFVITVALVGLHLAVVTTWPELCLVAGAFVLSILLADLGSGLVHWGADTWFTADAPIVGRMFVRSFREHHVVQAKITEHGWVQANGEASGLSSFLFLTALYFRPESGQTWWLAAWTVFVSTVFLLVLTNQFHKWAHIKRPGGLVGLAQNIGLLQTYKRHAYHHAVPFTRAYCITTGWLNPLLDAIGFWRFCERMVHKFTGAVPREDDIGHEAAVQLWNKMNEGRRGYPLPIAVVDTDSAQA